MKDYYAHVALILGLAAIAVLGFAVIPEHAYDKIGGGLSVLAADPAGAAGGLAVLGVAVASFIATVRRALYTPPPAGTGTTVTKSSGEPRS